MTGIDTQLGNDAMAKFAAVIGLLRRLEECPSCDTKDDLLILLEDAFQQFASAGLEPDNEPTVAAQRGA